MRCFLFYVTRQRQRRAYHPVLISSFFLHWFSREDESFEKRCRCMTRSPVENLNSFLIAYLWKNASCWASVETNLDFQRENDGEERKAERWCFR